MSINYSLVENRLKANRGEYYAQVHSLSTADMEDVIKKMVDRGSTITSADIRSVLDDLSGTLKSLLEDGRNITLPFVNYSVSIKGNFIGLDDQFDSSRHSVKCNSSTGIQLKKELANTLHPVKTKTTIRMPSPISFTDYNSGKLDSIATPDGIACIKGSKLKFNKANDKEGIFFIAEDFTEIKVEVIGVNEGKTLIFEVPPLLTPGQYKLEVRNSYGNEVRAGKLSALLTAE